MVNLAESGLVGYMLRRMIDAGAPPEWGAHHRLIAGLIADDARDPDPAHPLPEGEWPWSAIPVEGELRRGAWRDGLAELAGMSPRAISRALAEIAATGYEMRQPIAGKDGAPVTDKRGRLVFAAKGHALRFTVPPLRPRAEPQRSPLPATYDGQRSPDPAGKDADSSPDLASFEAQRSPLLASKVAENGDPISSLSPQLSSTSEIQPPQPPLLAGVADAEGGPPGAEEESTGEGDGRCRYAGCRTPGKPSRPGDGYHDPCRHLAEVRARQDQRDGEAAA